MNTNQSQIKTLDKPEINHELELLEDATSRMLEKVSILENKISVIMNDTCSIGETLGPWNSKCSLASNIKGTRLRVEDAESKIESMLNRIEL